jgi:hypothetical protein
MTLPYCDYVQSLIRFLAPSIASRRAESVRAWKSAEGIDNPAIDPSPVIAVAGEGPDVPAIEDDQRAIRLIGESLANYGRRLSLSKCCLRDTVAEIARISG